tara:strand:- start:6502 stop:7185 length:684 start_codon:yes stop_codon:yes gene_type:complete
MSYTWEEVMLGIDTRAEAKKEQKQLDDINEKRDKEQSAMGAWSLGLSLLGGALFGPLGYTAGKILGRQGADYYYDWESMDVEEGKFDADISRKVNKQLSKDAKDQNKAQVVQAVTDLGSMYIQAGGMTEGFDADFTTFGAGGDQWTMFGRGGEAPTTWASKGAGGMINPNTGEAIGSMVQPEGGIPSIFDVWRDDGLGSMGNKLKDVYTADLTANKAMSELDRLANQ